MRQITLIDFALRARGYSAYRFRFLGAPAPHSRTASGSRRRTLRRVAGSSPAVLIPRAWGHYPFSGGYGSSGRRSALRAPIPSRSRAAALSPWSRGVITEGPAANRYGRLRWRPGRYVGARPQPCAARREAGGSVGDRPGVGGSVIPLSTIPPACTLCGSGPGAGMGSIVGNAWKGGDESRVQFPAAPSLRCRVSAGAAVKHDAGAPHALGTPRARSRVRVRSISWIRRARVARHSGPCVVAVAVCAFMITAVMRVRSLPALFPVVGGAKHP